MENLENGVGDFVHNAVYHAKGYMGYSRQERRKQTFAHHLRKDRARQRMEERENRQRRRAGLPSIPALRKATNVSKALNGMKAPLKLRGAIERRFQDVITHKWRKLLKTDLCMQDLFAQEKNGEALGTGPQLLAQELEASRDSLDLEDIHPIFSHLNLEKCLLQTDLSIRAIGQATRNLRPALALATKLLTAPELQSWWYHLMYGTIGTSITTKKTQLLPSPMEQDIPTARADFAALLEALACRMQFYWAPFHVPNRPGPKPDAVHSTWGFWEMLSDYLDISKIVLRLARKRAQGYNGLIGISSMTLYHLLSPESPTRESLEQDTCLHVQLAFTLVHELAHAVYSLRRIPLVDVASWGTGEVYAYDTDISNEIGMSWENYACDGVILSSQVTKEHIEGIVAKSWKHVLVPGPWAYTHVPQEWLRDLFRKDTWKDVTKHMERLEKPIGRSGSFVAERWNEERWEFWPITYENRMATGETAFLEDGGRVTGNVEAWYERARELDMAASVRSGKCEYKQTRGPRGISIGWGIRFREEDEDEVMEEEEEEQEEEEELTMTNQVWY